MYLHRSRFQQLPWSSETIYLKICPKGRVQSLEPTQPDRQAGNPTAPTAPSAGNSPDPDGKGLAPLRSRRSLWQDFSHQRSWNREGPIAKTNNGRVPAPTVPCNSDRSDTRQLLNLQLRPVRFRPVEMEELAAGLVHTLVSMRTEIVALALQ